MALIKEADLLGPISSYARRQGYTRQLPEMQFYEYRIDLYALSRRTGLTVAVELKLHKWRRALEQALLYQLCADLVFIAMPEDALSRIDRDLISASGIGLIGVSERGCQLAEPARQSAEVRQYYKQVYVDLLKERNKWKIQAPQSSFVSAATLKKSTSRRSATTLMA
jgi:hypothetical protein